MRPTLLLLLCAAFVGVIAAPSAYAAKPSADISLRFVAGQTFEVRLQTGTHKTMGGKTRSDSTTLVTQRHIVKGGRYGKDAIQWRDKVTRMLVTDRGVSFDSDRDKAITADTAPFQLLAGLSLDAAITPKREVTVSNVKRDPSILRKAGYDEDLVKMMLASTSPKALASELSQGLAVIPNRTLKVGQRFKHRIKAPFGGQMAGLTVTFTFKLVKIVGDYAELSFTVKGPKNTKLGGVRLKGLKGSGTLRFNHAQGFAERMETKLGMVLVLGRTKVETNITLALSQRVLPPAQ